MFLVFVSVHQLAWGRESRSICFSYLFLSISSLGEERAGLYVSRICFCPSARLGKREQVYMFLVFVSFHQLAWGRESKSICFSCICLFIWHAPLSVFISSNWCHELVAACDCGSP